MLHPVAPRYGIALATFVVAAVARAALIPVFGSALPYITFYPAIMVSAWYGGLTPGLLTTAMGGITALLLWPAGGGGALTVISMLSAGLYLANGAAISLLTEMLHRGRRREQAFREKAVRHEREVERLLRTEREAHAVADTANRAKDQFLAMLSHELRTPLTSIIGWVAILRSRRFDPERFDHALEVIARNARAQQQLVEDLLDVSRIVSGKLSLEKTEIALAQLIENGVDAARDAAAAKSLTMAARREGAEDSWVLGDPVRLQQVVTNLLSNAIKFTPPGGRIDIGLERRDEHVRLVVQDTGEGIARDDLSRIFGRFEQGAATVPAGHGGLGLGLAITRDLVEAHGGVIRAESAGKGHGATFTVDLPVLAVRLGAQRHGVASRRYRRAHDATPRLDGLEILVVDDDADARETTAIVLRQSGAQVHLAESAPDALAVLSRVKVDVLVSDLGMPDADGYALIREVRAAERGSDRQGVTAVAFTARAGKDDRNHALASGFDAHIAKPVDPFELVAAIAAARADTRCVS